MHTVVKIYLIEIGPDKGQWSFTADNQSYLFPSLEKGFDWVRSLLLNQVAPQKGRWDQ